MSAPDLDEPRMIYMGPLPPHLLRKHEPPEEAPALENAQAGARGVNPALAISVAAAIALVTGIAIGAFLPPLLHAPQVEAHTASHLVLRPPIVQADAASAAPPAEELTSPARPQSAASPASAPAVAPRAAVALLTSPNTPASGRHRKADKPVANGCATLPSAADRFVCADPTVASADQDLKRAYQHAQAAGAPAAADEIDWLLFRNDAARRSPADLALAYRQRIDQLNSVANEPPH